MMIERKTQSQAAWKHTWIRNLSRTNLHEQMIMETIDP